MEKVIHTLPFDYDALEPYISKDIVLFHFDKHHQGYVNRYNQAISNYEDLKELSLEAVLAKLSKELQDSKLDRIKLFQDGAQAWNHNFFWHSISRNKQSHEESDELINASFGSLEEFKSNFISLGKSHFGSGWLWVVRSGNELDFCLTHDAESPKFNIQPVFTDRLKIAGKETEPILVCDLWEHSYYLQYKNDRENYLRCFVENLLDWSRFAEDSERGL